MRAEKCSYPAEVINRIVAPIVNLEQSLASAGLIQRKAEPLLSFFFQDLDEICSGLKDTNKDRRRVG